MQGGLYTQDFLERGITEEAAWSALSNADLAAFKAEVAPRFTKFATSYKPNEGVTEKDLIFPILEALGWTDALVQQQVSSRRRDDVPDALLFASAELKAAANKEKEPAKRYRHGLAVVEAKRWQRPLDRADAQGTPSSQMLRYLRRAEDASDGKLEWGILTNGRQWRLYWQGARSRAEEFLELDLPAILEMPGFSLDLFAAGADADHWLRVFVLMFRRASFLRTDTDQSFHTEALRQTRKWEAKVAEGLTEQVFGEVFPEIVRSLARAEAAKVAPRPLNENELEDVRRAALTLLYRLLFVLYAEDRRLLPVDHPGYEAYSLDRQRSEIADRVDRGDVLSDRIDARYGSLRALFKAIDGGDPSLGLPPYNGGLFDSAEHPLLERTALPDSVLARVVDTLSRRLEGERKLRINYRDLSVQQLGSIYEGLLEFAVVPHSTEVASIQPNIFARKGSGSYYTPEDLVRLIVDRTVGPLLDERQSKFDAALAKLASDRRPKLDRIEELRSSDPAASFLTLRVCDPAMGSGHFLVTLVDVLADRTLAAMADAESKARDAFGLETIYRSPLQDQVEEIRARIRARAEREGWRVADNQLDDRHIVRRMILKRVVYGVDKNAMAVELAKVSLWLHTFTVGAPLSFLDHHLRCGDSLFGEFIRPVEDFLRDRGSLALAAPLKAAQGSARAMAKIEEMSDADLTEVTESERSFGDVEVATRPLNAFLDFFHSLRWLDRLPKKSRRIARRGMGSASAGDAVVDILEGALGDPVQVVAEGAPKTNGHRANEALDVLKASDGVARREHFMHWQVAFPGVWQDWESTELRGGFDAVIGNPPWDRIKLEEIEWFAVRRIDIAKLEKAADRRKRIMELKQSGDPLFDDYEQAALRAESAARVARQGGSYPLLSGGDTNVYSLFVERAHSLIKPDGIVGLLVPSGIASDLTASAFFRDVASTGRIRDLLDFFNKSSTGENFFPDVYYRFKFCVFVTTGPNRKSKNAQCGFYLRSIDDVQNAEKVFPLSPKDFEAVNPNTRTAPLFRSRREAQITKTIHSSKPVLVLRPSRGKEIAVWPVKYLRMLDMANDSSKFRSRAQLEDDGFYLVDGGLLRRGSRQYLPLYEGKMVQAFDHRAADVVIASGNLFRPGQQTALTTEDHADPTRYPHPRYYVSEVESGWPAGVRSLIAFKDITSVTNARTMIAAAIPQCGAGHTLPVLAPTSDDAKAVDQYLTAMPFMLANLNSFAFDFLARQRVQGNHLTWFLVEQVPVIPIAAYQGKIGKSEIGHLVRDEVLHLTYTAKDMQPFAEDLGFRGEPFVWDEEDRRHRRARLDALFFGLYGITEADAGYILETFPIIREQDEAAFKRYRTKELVLSYMRAFAAGDTQSRVAR